MNLAKIFQFAALAFIVGVFLVSFNNEIGQWWWLGLILGLIALLFGIKNIFARPGRDFRFIFVGVILLFLALGAWRFSIFKQGQENISQLPYQKDVALRGIISKEPEINEVSQKAELTIKSQIDSAGEKNMSGKIILTLDRNANLAYGDEVLFQGKLKAPINYDGFDYKSFLAMQGISALGYFPKLTLLERGGGNPLISFLFKLRENFEQKIDEIFAEPYGSFLSGLLLGAKKSMSKEVLDEFNKTGTTHIVAISGYNITLIALIFMGFLLALGLARPHAFYFAVIGIILFTLLTGASASVVRAAIMGILILIAQKAGRLSLASNAVILAGAAMIAINPSLLRFDVGFQLSFLATLSLIYLVPFFEEKMKWLPEFWQLKSIFIATLSAQIAVMPVLLYNFGRVSLIAPLVNLLILPLVPLAMGVGFAAVMAGFLWLGFGRIIGYAAWLILKLLLEIVHLFSGFSFASFEAQKIGVFWFVIYYAALLFFVAMFMKKRKEALLAEI